MIHYTDDTTMPFGKYKGAKMINVPAGYLLWLRDEGVEHPGVKQYIIENLAVLKEQAKSEKYRAQ